MKTPFYLILLIFFTVLSCSVSGNQEDTPISVAKLSEVTSYLTGSSADVTTTTQGGLLLMGGSTDVDEAIAWLLARSGGGDVVVIRASGADGYNKYMYNMLPVNSVETLIINSREKANLPSIEQKIRNSEALFIAGGDQWDYVNYWKDSPVEDAINYLINTKKVSIGGTSAGCAILGGTYFKASKGTVTTEQSLANPYNQYMTIGQADFIIPPNMQNVITDSHYTQRNRQGRHIAFLAKMMKDFGNTAAKGIGVDEETALCIDENGIGKVYGKNEVYFLQNNTQSAETFQSDSPLNWVRSNQAVKAYKITGNTAGNGTFNAATWELSGGKSYFYYVDKGVLMQN